MVTKGKGNAERHSLHDKDQGHGMVQNALLQQLWQLQCQQMRNMCEQQPQMRIPFQDELQYMQGAPRSTFQHGGYHLPNSGAIQQRIPAYAQASRQTSELSNMHQNPRWKHTQRIVDNEPNIWPAHLPSTNPDFARNIMEHKSKGKNTDKGQNKWKKVKWYNKNRQSKEKGGSKGSKWINNKGKTDHIWRKEDEQEQKTKDTKASTDKKWLKQRSESRKSRSKRSRSRKTKRSNSKKKESRKDSTKNRRKSPATSASSTQGRADRAEDKEPHSANSSSSSN